MTSYGEYTLVEQHIDISRRLSELDRRARAFIHQIEKCKGIGGKKQYERDVQDILSILHSLSKPKILNHNLFSSLHYYLDDQMFSEVAEVSIFMMEDEHYPISAIYFDKERWIVDKVFHIEEMTHSTTFTSREASLLLLFFTDYEDLTNELEQKVATTKEGKVKTKLKRILTRIKKRYLKGLGIVADRIFLDVNKKIENNQRSTTTS